MVFGLTLVGDLLLCLSEETQKLRTTPSSEAPEGGIRRAVSGVCEVALTI